MAITVKKKSLKLKSAEAPPAGDGTEAQAAPARESAPVLATMGTPSSASAPKSSGSFVFSFIAALIACVLLGALLAIQFAENTYYTGMVP